MGTKPISVHEMQANQVHGNKYTYNWDSFVDVMHDMLITCPEHGDFRQSLNSHKRGRGCPVCGALVKQQKAKKDVSAHAASFAAVHGNRYTYDWNSFTTVRGKMRIICPVHGEFYQTPHKHKLGRGCPHCANVGKKLNQRFTRAQWEPKFKAVHGDKFVYRWDTLVNAVTPMKVSCTIHGDFQARPCDLVNGHGCPSCAKATLSQPEWDIIEIVKSHGYETRHGYRPAWMNGKELDIFVPALNLAIEYCGSWVHNATKAPFGGQPKDKWYHYDKWKLCRDNGVTLLTIYDFEWMTSRDKWEAVIRHKLQKADRRVYARKCQIVPVEREVARAFCREHHIEGVGGMWLRTSECRGLEYQGELVAISVCEEGDIKRSCTKSGVAVIGGVSKLFKSFPAGTTMMTTNNTGSSGNYGTLVEKKTLRYWWVKLGTEPKAYPRRQCQKHMLEKRFGQPVGDKTERQYMEDLGFVRCYDSGLSYWVNG